MSRADLTRMTSMSRSTVGGALADLHRWGVVDSTMPAEFVKAGRPSASVTVVRDRVFTVVLDIGPRLIRHATMRLDGSLDAAGVVDITEHDPEAVIAALEEILARYLGEREGLCVGIGISLPGVVAADGTATLVLPLGWEQVPFADRLRERIGSDIPITIAQDALLAAKSEFVWGAGSELGRMLYLISRDHGVGGAIVGSGSLDGAQHPLQAGHIQVRTDGKHCECGGRGCLETYIEADAVRTVLHGLGVEAEPLVQAVQGVADSDQREHFVEAVVEPFRVGLVTLVNALGPDGVVLGGGLGALAEMFFPELESAVASTVVARVREVPLMQGTAEEPILLGCGLAAFEPLFRDPRDCGINENDKMSGAMQWR